MLGSTVEDYQYERQGLHGPRLPSGNMLSEGDPSKRQRLDNLQYGKHYVEAAVRVMSQLHSSLITQNPSNARVSTALEHAFVSNNPSQKVLNARRALGADDEAYLSTGIMLLWAGDGDDEDLDRELLLYPTSDRSISSQSEGPAKGWVAAMDIEMRGRSDQAHALLSEVAEQLAVFMSMKDVRSYLQEAVKAAGVVADADGAGLVAAIESSDELGVAELKLRILQESTRLAVSQGDSAVEGTRNLVVVMDALADLWTSRSVVDPNVGNEGAATFVRELVEQMPSLSAKSARSQDAALVASSPTSPIDVTQRIVHEGCDKRRLEKSMADSEAQQRGQLGVSPTGGSSALLASGGTIDQLSAQMDTMQLESVYPALRNAQDSRVGVYEDLDAPAGPAMHLVLVHQHLGIDPGDMLSLKHRRLLDWDEKRRTRLNETISAGQPELTRDQYEANSDNLIVGVTNHDNREAPNPLPPQGSSLEEHRAGSATEPLFPDRYLAAGRAYNGMNNRQCAVFRGTAERFLMPPVLDFGQAYELAESDTLRCTLGTAQFHTPEMKTFQAINAGIAAGAATFNAVERADQWMSEVRTAIGISDDQKFVIRSVPESSGMQRVRVLLQRLPESIKTRKSPSTSLSSSTPAITRAIGSMRRSILSREFGSRRTMTEDQGRLSYTTGLRRYDQMLWSPRAPSSLKDRGPVGSTVSIATNPDVENWAGYGVDTEAAREMVNLFYIDSLQEVFEAGNGDMARATQAQEVMAPHNSTVAFNAMRAGIQIAKLDALRRIQKMPEHKLKRVYENAIYSIHAPLDRTRTRVRAFFDPQRKTVTGTTRAGVTMNTTSHAARRLVSRLDPGAATVYRCNPALNTTNAEPLFGNNLEYSMPVEGTSVQPTLPSVGVVNEKYGKTKDFADRIGMSSAIPHKVREQFSVLPGDETNATTMHRWTAVYPQRKAYDDASMMLNEYSLGNPSAGFQGVSTNHSWNGASTDPDSMWPDEFQYKVNTDIQRTLPPSAPLPHHCLRAMLTEFVAAMDWDDDYAYAELRALLGCVLGFDVTITRPAIELVPHSLGTRFIGIPGPYTKGDGKQKNFLAEGNMSLSDTARRRYAWPDTTQTITCGPAPGWFWTRTGLGALGAGAPVLDPRDAYWPEDPRVRDTAVDDPMDDGQLMRNTYLAACAFALASPEEGAESSQAGIVNARVKPGYDPKSEPAAMGFSRWKNTTRKRSLRNATNTREHESEARYMSRHRPNFKTYEAVDLNYRQVDVMIGLADVSASIHDMRPVLLIPRWNLPEGSANFVDKINTVMNTQRILQMYGTAVFCADGSSPSPSEAAAAAAGATVDSDEVWTLKRDRVTAGQRWNAVSAANPTPPVVDLLADAAWHRARRNQLGGHHNSFPAGDIDLFTNIVLGTGHFNPATNAAPYPTGQVLPQEPTMARGATTATEEDRHSMAGPQRLHTPRISFAYASSNAGAQNRLRNNTARTTAAANDNSIGNKTSLVGILLLVKKDSDQETAASITDRVKRILGLPRRDDVKIYHSVPPTDPRAATHLLDSERVNLFREDIPENEFVAVDGNPANDRMHLPIDCPVTLACVDVLCEPSALPVQDSIGQIDEISTQIAMFKQQIALQDVRPAQDSARPRANKPQKRFGGAQKTRPDARGRVPADLDRSATADPTQKIVALNSLREQDGIGRFGYQENDLERLTRVYRSAVRPFYAPTRSMLSACTPALQALVGPIPAEAGIVDSLSDSRVANRLYSQHADENPGIDDPNKRELSSIRYLMQYSVHERVCRDLLAHSVLAKQCYLQLVASVQSAIPAVVIEQANVNQGSKDDPVPVAQLEAKTDYFVTSMINYMQSNDAEAFEHAMQDPRMKSNASTDGKIASWAISLARSPTVQLLASVVAGVPSRKRPERSSWAFLHTEDAWVTQDGAPFLVGVADGKLTTADAVAEPLYMQAVVDNNGHPLPVVDNNGQAYQATQAYRIFHSTKFQLSPTDAADVAPFTPGADIAYPEANPHNDLESLIQFEIRKKFDDSGPNERETVEQERDDIWDQLRVASRSIDSVCTRKNKLPDWMSFDGLWELSNVGRIAAGMLASAAHWRSHSDDIRHELRRMAEDNTTRKQAERQRRSSLWLDAMRELAITNDRLYIFLRTLAGTLHESIDAVIEVNDSSVQRAQEQERSRRTEALRKANDFSNRVMQTVFGAALKSAKLDFGLSGGEIVVLSQSSVEEVRRLAEGESGVGYFEAAQRLQTAVNSPQGVPLERMMQSVAAVLHDLRQQQVNAVDEQTSDVLRSSFEYLSAPRNSFTVRLKAEASAAIRTAWSTFCVEWQGQSMGRLRRPSAYELIEGPDNVMRTTFAQYVAYQLSHSRIFSSSSAVYVSRNSSQTNFSMMRVTLMKLIRRAVEYVHANPRPLNYSYDYVQQSAHERNPWGQVGGAAHDAAAMASANLGMQTASRYAYGPAAGGVGGYGGPTCPTGRP